MSGLSVQKIIWKGHDIRNAVHTDEDVLSGKGTPFSPVSLINGSAGSTQILLWNHTVQAWQLKNAGVYIDAGGTVQGTDGNTYNIRAYNQGLPVGNARGEYSVDLQTLRGAGGQAATGKYSVISGGANNTASGSASVVSGGKGNTASGDYSSVTGGLSNAAQGDYSTVLGGNSNTASANYSAVVGGYNNTASGVRSSVINGQSNQATGKYNSIIAGQSNKTTGSNSVVICGNTNKSYGDYSAVIAGKSNTLTGDHSVILAGNLNTLTGDHSIASGYNNIVQSNYSVILGSTKSKVYSDYNAVLGSRQCFIFGASSYNSAIIASRNVDVTGKNSVVIGIGSGSVSANNAVILSTGFAAVYSDGGVVIGGTGNYVTASNSVIISGYYHYADKANSVIISGRYGQPLVAGDLVHSRYANNYSAGDMQTGEFLAFGSGNNGGFTALSYDDGSTSITLNSSRVYSFYIKGSCTSNPAADFGYWDFSFSVGQTSSGTWRILGESGAVAASIDVADKNAGNSTNGGTVRVAVSSGTLTISFNPDLNSTKIHLSVKYIVVTP